MLELKKAIEIVQKNLPSGKIQLAISYHGLYVFQVFTTNPFEEELDPFYSVNQETGEFRDFSVLTDGSLSELSELFMNAKKEKTQ